MGDSEENGDSQDSAEMTRTTLVNDFVLRIEDAEDNPYLHSSIPVLADIRPINLKNEKDSIQDMINDLTYGYNPLDTIPTTLLEFGRHLKTRPKDGSIAALLVDCPQIRPYTWVKFGKRLGFITGITSKLDLEIPGSNLVVVNVEDEKITPVPLFYRGLYILYETWIGCVTSTRHKLRIQLEKKGYECFIYESRPSDQGHRKLCLKCPGERISLSGEDVKNAEWLKAPNFWDWIFLRFLNFGDTEHTAGKVLENEVCGITVSWLGSTATSQVEMNPPIDLSEKDFPQVHRLTLPAKDYLSYGVFGKYRIQRGDTILDSNEGWDEFLLQEQGYKLGNAENEGSGDAAVYIKPSEKTLEDLVGTEITGKVIFKRAVADVKFISETEYSVSRIDVKYLIPCLDDANDYSSPGNPVISSKRPGSLELNKQVQTLAQRSDPEKGDGTDSVRWLEVGMKRREYLVSKEWPATDPLDELNPINTQTFLPGTIVSWDLASGSLGLGVVVGTDVDVTLWVLVQVDEEILKVEPFKLRKLEKIACMSSSSVDGGVVWKPISETSMGNKHMTSFPPSIHLGNVNPASGMSLSKLESRKWMKHSFTASNHKFYEKYREDYQVSVDGVYGYPLMQQHLESQNKLVAEMLEGLDWIWIVTDSKLPGLMSILMRALTQTPYEFGLFSFDLYIPAGYPDEPPLVCYSNTHGVELEGVPDSGLIDVMDYLDEKEEDFNLPSVLSLLRDEIFKTSAAGSGVRAKTKNIFYPFGSYTRGVTEPVKNQEILKNVVQSIPNWIHNDPQTFWDEITWEYYKIHVPRIISCMKRWVLAPEQPEFDHVASGGGSQQSSESCKISSYRDELPDFPLNPIDPTLQYQMELALTNLADTYGKFY